MGFSLYVCRGYIKGGDKMQKSELCKSLDRIDSLVDELIDANRELEKAEKCRDQGMKFINGKEA